MSKAFHGECNQGLKSRPKIGNAFGTFQCVLGLACLREGQEMKLKRGINLRPFMKPKESEPYVSQLHDSMIPSKQWGPVKR